MRNAISFAAIILLGTLASWTAASTGFADDVLTQLETAKQRTAGPGYLLRYQFRNGESVRYSVVHRTTSKTRVGETRDYVQTRSVSTKLWKVEDVDADGNTTFDHVVEDVDMWNQISGVQEVRYNSRTDEEPPLGYETVAENVGVVLARITIDPYGNVIKRQDRDGYSGVHGEQIVVRLPPRQVRVGDSWYSPHEIILRGRDGQFQRIKTRKFYQLEKVSAGVASIHVETQVLTPIDSPTTKGQLAKWLTAGIIKFDLDAGRVLSQELNTDERVIGFSTPDSMMEYLAQMTEKLLPADEKVAEREKSDAK